jgi:SAM-dependent methyltransferase
MHNTADAPIIHLDSPADGLIGSAQAPVQGWLATHATGSIGDLYLANSRGVTVPLQAVDRPDVRLAVSGLTSMGFSGWIGIREAVDGPWSVHYTQNGVASEISIPLAGDQSRLDAFFAAKARKLAAIRALLRCPACRAPLEGNAPTLRCSAGHTFTASTPERYDFLSESRHANGGASTFDYVSAHGYDAVLLDLIARSEGPIVDVGAGLRSDYREDVLNVEIVPYLTTDVVAESERLPFADNSFALVISVAVLEHVRDPFAAARELMRILRPGGRIFAAVPFLQPYHAYPNHYYNMTAAGLRNLFTDCDVERLEVPQSGGPAFALTWILKAWHSALSPEIAAQFANMRVADLAVDPYSLLDQPFVKELPPSVNEELASLNILVGKKRD